MTVSQAIAACNFIDPWMSMVRCNLSDGGVVTATGENTNTGAPATYCYTDTGVARVGQCAVPIKKFWYTTDLTTSGTYKWWISDTGEDALPVGADHAWAGHLAFIRNGVTKDQIYLGAFEAYLNATKLESKAGVAPTCLKTRDQFRTAAQARGTGWEQNDWLAISALQLLALLEYGTFNSQLAIGNGISDDTGVKATGATGSTGTDRGNASYGTVADAITAMSYRGIENVYGNCSKFLDGINVTSSVAWVADHGFADDTYSGAYESTSFSIPAAVDAFVNDIHASGTYDYSFIPKTASGGSASTYLCDKTLTGPSGTVVNYGGCYWDGTGAGMFKFDCSNISNWANADVGTRLMYVG
jgi:hypothetical protein